LQDGSIGLGLFTTPDGVNPAQASQTFNLSDLSVTKTPPTGQPGTVLLNETPIYTVQPGATATYANGTLVAVNATAIGPDTINHARLRASRPVLGCGRLRRE